MEIHLGFVFEVFDEVAGQIARTRFRSGGSKSSTCYNPCAIRWWCSYPELHADNLEGI